MSGKVKAVFLSTLIVVFGGAYLAFQAFAEGDVNCSIQITGHAKNTNPNAGDTTFDSHWVDVEGEDVIGGITASLKILGIDTPGLVPYWTDPAYQYQRQFAACAEEEREGGKIKDVGGNKIPDKYLLKGFMWNDNIGYISLGCENGSNESVPCGGFDYGVFTDEPIPGSPAKVKGYAWNPVFGYINFNCSGGAVGGSTGVPGDLTNCGIIPYGVTMDPETGALSGYAYSQAGIYLGFSGVNVAIKGVPEEPPIEHWCDGVNWTGACVEVDVEGALLPESGPKLADGTDGYTINLYLRDSNKQPASLDTFDVTMRFFWDDTVKKDQVSDYKVEDDMDDMQNPWSQTGAGEGAVEYKPISVVDGDFAVVPGEPGHYQLKTEISSYAPTRDGNTSLTTSTDPALNFQNEVFLNKVDGIPSDQEANYLKLKRVQYSLKNGGVDVVPPNSIIYANGKLDLSLPFEPVYSFETLYADDRQDAIKAFRSVPTIFKVKAVEADNALSPEIGSVLAALTLAYDSTKTVEKCGLDYPGGVRSDFDFFFSDPDGTLAGQLSRPPDISIIVDGKPQIAQFFGIFKSVGAFDLAAEATFPETGDTITQLCGFVQAPSLYTRVRFKKDGKEVRYYANKLPRLGGDVVANPAIVVHGNVYSQYSCSVNAGIAAVSPVGDQTISSVKNAIDKNVKSYGGAISDINNDSTCNVTSLVDGGDCGPDKKFEVKGSGEIAETVLYYKNTDVYLNPTSSGSGKYAIVVDGGNLYIESDLYNSEGELAIAVFKKTPKEGDADSLKFSKSGNVFIDTTVKNIQASLIADGSIFSKVPGMDEVAYTKLLDDGDLNELNNYFVNLSGNSYQLLWEGGVSARNSIGGADLCGKSSYFFRGNETTQNKKLAQLYDLNYLRLFRLDLETFNGLPIDQVCGKALNVEDMVAILNDDNIWDADSVHGDKGSEYPCNGIDPFHAFDSRDGHGYDEGSGDLVPAASEDKLVEDLRWPTGEVDEAHYNPVYIFYKASDSFLFRTK
ncbi:MAG: hypothetical protein WC873_02530 [Candidatus Gracilibacteria bacterium]